MISSSRSAHVSLDDDISASAAEIRKAKAAAEGRHGLYDGPDSSFKLAFDDPEFLTRHETRGIRFQLEISKPDMVFRDEGIKHTIVVFGSARFKSPEQAQALLAQAQASGDPRSIRQAELAVRNSIHYQKAYDFGRLVGSRNLALDTDHRLHILTGGGPGVMEAANRGAFEAGDKTIGMNIALPFEQEPNPYITPRLCFQFHYFGARKFSFLASGSSTPGKTLEPGNGMSEHPQISGGGAAAMVCFAGGFGTLDEFFEAVTLCQTGKMRPRPMIMVGKDYWNGFMNLRFLADEGAISPEDLDLIQIVDTPEEAFALIKDFYSLSV